MQTINSTLQYSETAHGLTQRGNAEIHQATSVQVKELYRFPGVTPERQRIRRTVVNTQTPDMIRQQQITSATENAFSHFQKRERVLTPEEVQAYAQWILQADQLLETMRVSAERGE